MNQPKDHNNSFGRIAYAREYARQNGIEPLRPEDREEFMRMIAEFTNL